MIATRASSRIIVSFCLTLLTANFGCGGGSSSNSDCQKICSGMASRCGAPQSSCEQSLCPTIPLAGCYAAIEAAACTDLENVTGSWADLCFPKCSAIDAQCNGDGTISMCTDDIEVGELRSATVICSELCSYNSGSYSGSCGASYGSQMSSTGNDVCWCKS